MKLFTTCKILLITIFMLVASLGFSQTSTFTYIDKTVSEKNYINNYKYGQTAYQVDRSQYKLPYTQPNGSVIYVYYYYVWFYNYSYEYYGGNWNKTSTYLSSIDVTIDGQHMGNNWMLITGDYYYLSYWSMSPTSQITIIHSKPLPY